MVFNSLTFIVFFAIVLGLFWMPFKWTTRKIILLVASRDIDSRWLATDARVDARSAAERAVPAPRRHHGTGLERRSGLPRPETLPLPHTASG
jgi:hypothetical protein